MSIGTFPLDAAHAATVAQQEMTHAGDESRGLMNAWRFAVCQLIDDYQTVRKHDGLTAASRLFDTPPVSCGNARVDATLAALAEHIARRDGWPPPAWCFDEWRTTDRWWFVAGLRSLHAMALVQSPLAFRTRGVFICDGDLTRV